jgi:hypothetical protein
MYLSALKTYVEAMGGNLELIIRFPKQPPLRLSGLGDVLVPGESRASRVALAPEEAPNAPNNATQFPSAYYRAIRRSELLLCCHKPVSKFVVTLSLSHRCSGANLLHQTPAMSPP